MIHRLSQELELETIECCNCFVVFAMPSSLNKQRKASGGSFWCPNGHSQRYTKLEVDRLKEKLEQQMQSATAMAERARKAEIEAEKAKKEIKRINKRASAGVCPCCNRTFQQLARHMKTKHPEKVL